MSLQDITPAHAVTKIQLGLRISGQDNVYVVTEYGVAYLFGGNLEQRKGLMHLLKLYIQKLEKNLSTNLL